MLGLSRIPYDHRMQEADLRRQLAKAHKLLNSQSTESLAIALEVRNQARERDLPELEASALCLMANCVYDFGNYSEVLDYLQEVGQIAARAPIGRQEGEQLQALGRTYYTMGDYRRASDYWRRCLTLPDCAISLETRIKAHIGMGQLFYASEHFESALAHHRRAEELAASSDDYHLQAAILINIGVDLSACQKLAEAHVVLKGALPLVKADQNYRNEAEIYALIGQIQLLNAEYDKARMSLLVALKINRLHINLWGEASTLLTLGKVYFASGMIDIAREQLVEALNKACSLGALHLQQHLHEILSRVYRHLAQEELASGHESLFHTLRQQLLVQTGEGELETMELRLEYL